MLHRGDLGGVVGIFVAPFGVTSTEKLVAGFFWDDRRSGDRRQKGDK
jgi:hypothetical protein